MCLLEGEITAELDAFPRVAREWILQFRQTEEEKRECNPIYGFVERGEFQDVFTAVKEKTTSSPSEINYTLWRCIASSDAISAYMAIMMCLPFMHRFVNDRWAKCINILLEKKRGCARFTCCGLRIIGSV